MEIVNLLSFKERSQLRWWLEENHDKERTCWVVSYCKNKPEWDALAYIDIVEEALGTWNWGDG